ncbi:glycine cleavage system protein GcvH [Thermosynechococcus vestitus]|uniref:Glycine cleavage system H protein n=1 Tax=Thermosynechococcus vestitus (strain NIES-2133 / IAM M-273 / BP-1) TaxID=197221 RepID=GCSH_THEVB|nr:glycine cleavage system protein GcvH [Thermosynechococcus vestitus]Q8DIB2.2 RecName: Full=Glycine cleavage system H protein [Thermosynechococcus vestitus BP-1]BAY50827.1 glycine cleavage system H protein [Thermostichus vulcanus NIES-2134]
MTLTYPEDLQYLDSHEYLRLEGDTATLGISAFAVDQLGDIVFVELPAVGDALEPGERFGTIESVKAVEDLYAPLGGTVIAVNQAVIDNPEQIAADPYGEGWLVKVQVSTLPTGLLSAADYRALVEGS